jgi:hypothetical protein
MQTPPDTPSQPSDGCPEAPTPQPQRSCKLSENRLTLRIGDKITEYRLEELESHPLIGLPAFRLTKLKGGEPSDYYEVILTQWGPECNCADATFRHQNDGTYCKHISALMAAGKLSTVPRGTPGQ